MNGEQLGARRDAPLEPQFPAVMSWFSVFEAALPLAAFPLVFAPGLLPFTVHCSALTSWRATRACCVNPVSSAPAFHACQF